MGINANSGIILSGRSRIPFMLPYLELYQSTLGRALSDSKEYFSVIITWGLESLMLYYTPIFFLIFMPYVAWKASQGVMS